jgi:hypothetical protein
MTNQVPDQIIPVGRLLSSSSRGCAVGCLRTQTNSPVFGEMLRIPLEDGFTIYGLVYDIHVDDDGLVRQLATTEHISPEVIEDHHHNRNVPLELSLLFVGYERAGVISYLLPPRPPLSLDVIESCSAADLARFTAVDLTRITTAGQFGYLRHLLGDPTLPAVELLAVHIQAAFAAHNGDLAWRDGAVQTLIAMLKDDYPQLLAVLGALSETA